MWRVFCFLILAARNSLPLKAFIISKPYKLFFFKTKGIFLQKKLAIQVLKISLIVKKCLKISLMMTQNMMKSMCFFFQKLYTSNCNAEIKL